MESTLNRLDLASLEDQNGLCAAHIKKMQLLEGEDFSQTLQRLFYVPTLHTEQRTMCISLHMISQFMYSKKTYFSCIYFL